MDVLQIFTDLITTQASPYLAGVIAAFTPCTIAVIPIILYRFGIWSGGEKATIIIRMRQLALLSVAFLFSFLLAGLGFQQLFNSEFVNVARIVLSVVLLLLSVMVLRGGSFNAIFAQVTHPALLGVSLPWLISFSPCVLPWLAFVTVSGANAVGNFVLFGLGLLTPPVFLALVGNVGIGALRKATHSLLILEKIAPLLLLVAAGYIGLQLFNFTTNDALLTSLIVLVITGGVAISVYRAPSQRTLYNAQMLLFSLLWLGLVTFLAYKIALPATARLTNEQLLFACLPGENSFKAENLQEFLVYGSHSLLLAFWLITASKRSQLLRFSWQDEVSAH